MAGEPPRWRRLAGSSKINFFFKYLYQPLPLLLLFHILTLIFEKDLQKRLDLAFYGSEFFYLFSLKWRRMLLVVWVSTQTQVLSLLPHQNDSEPPLLFLVLVRKRKRVVDDEQSRFQFVCDVGKNENGCCCCDVLCCCGAVLTVKGRFGCVGS